MVPCYGCGDREMGCHANCERYKDFVASRRRASFAHKANAAVARDLRYVRDAYRRLPSHSDLRSI